MWVISRKENTVKCSPFFFIVVNYYNEVTLSLVTALTEYKVLRDFVSEI